MSHNISLLVKTEPLVDPPSVSSQITSPAHFFSNLVMENDYFDLFLKKTSLSNILSDHV